MQQLFRFGLMALLFAGCKKEKQSGVAIYLLKSFTTSVNQATTPATVSINNAVLDDSPLVSDNEIRHYTQATATFTVKKDIQSIIQHYGADKAFAVVVNDDPVYYGLFRPLYLSSIVFGVANISPLSLDKYELPILFPTITGSTILPPLDKRNNSRILEALRAAGKLR
jgi:hypothetical protein